MRWQATASDIPEIAACVHDDTATRKQHTACAIAGDLMTSIAAQRRARPERRRARIPKRCNRSRAGFPTAGALDQPRSGPCPVVVTCDGQLAAIDPDLVVHQVKESSTRYYCAPSGKPSTELRATSSPKPNPCPPSPAHAAAANSESCAGATSDAKRCAPQALSPSAIPSMRRRDSTDGGH